MNIPNDPVMLLSYINTQLRDFYPTLNELCSALNLRKMSSAASFLPSTTNMMRKQTSLYKYGLLWR